MTFGITAAGVATAVKVGTAAYGAYGAIKGAGGGAGGAGGSFYMPEAPDYYEDPDYREIQDYLKGYGMDLLEGNIPSYYKAIGETGSPEFEASLGKSKRDVMRSTTEALAAGGRARGGQLAASTAQAVGDLSIKARYEDYERSLRGKESLLRIGSGITERVRDAGRLEGGNVNQFNSGQFRMFSDNYFRGKELERDENIDRGKGIGNMGTIISDAIKSDTGKSVLGKIGNIFSRNKSTGTTPYGYSGSKVGFDEFGNPMSIA